MFLLFYFLYKTPLDMIDESEKPIHIEICKLINEYNDCF